VEPLHQLGRWRPRAWALPNFQIAREPRAGDSEKIAVYVAEPDGNVCPIMGQAVSPVGGVPSCAAPGTAAVSLFDPCIPVGEQQRIAVKVDSLLGRAKPSQERLDKIPTILKRFRHSVLAAACEGRLTTDWRGFHAKIAPASKLLDRLKELRRGTEGGRGRPSAVEDDEELPTAEETLPDTWTLCRVDDIARVCLGGTPSRKEPSYWGGEIPWVSSGEVANSRIRSTTERITKAGLENSNAKVYPKGSVLIAMIGEGKTRGQSAILEIAACTNQNVAGLLFESDELVPEYVWFWALSEYEKTRAVGRGGNQPALNGQRVRALPFPLPPTEEQREIVIRVQNLLQTADLLENRFSAANKYVAKLSQSILAKAFRGELVPTEAELARREGRSYETAEELLARIKQGQTPATHRVTARNGRVRHRV
jgi:type I restriction enzyme S subunit